MNRYLSYERHFLDDIHKKEVFALCDNNLVIVCDQNINCYYVVPDGKDLFKPSGLHDCASRYNLYISKARDAFEWRYGYQGVSVEEVIDNSPEKIQELLIFNLDLFINGEMSDA